MTVVIWILAFIILLLAYTLVVRERTREFAVLRLIGASRGMLGRMALLESALCGLGGGIAGTGLAAIGVFSFSTLIESSLGLPYLFPGIGTILLLAAGTVLLSIAVSALASAFAARRLSRVQPGTALREGN
jgi:putative ABC transport system permease protein